MDLSSPKLYLPMLNGLMLGEAMSDHDGVRCYPAIRHSNQDKYIVKVISVPASQVQLDAMLLTGAFPSREAALEYYLDVSRDILRETDILRQLSQQEGFIPYLDAQIISNDDFTGYEVYLLGSFKQSAALIFETETLTHKNILHMGLDMCAALAACRREGYLYVDLKPENIFYSEDRGYRIGDVGFASLASLTYSSLPEKYRSRYTAPELLDEMAVLNGTVDVYSLGLVLYEAYNGGELPDISNGQPLPAPLYADYEFTDIILKACHPDPSKRWKDPTQLAQAIIEYIQRNSAADEPIIPQMPQQTPEEPADAEEFLPETDPEELRQEMDALDDSEFEDLDILADLGRESINEDEALSDLPVPEEIDEILAQADELIAHELPEPPVAPAPIDVPMPERITLEDEAEEAPAIEPAEQPDEILPEVEPTSDPEPEPEEIKITRDEPKKPQPAPRPLRRFPWKLVSICLLIIALLGVGISGYYYYDTVYLQRVDDLILEQRGDTLCVKVVTAADNSLLTVICSDSYGNTMRQSVTAGIAIFTDLDPQTHYSVHLEISGFHRLVGVLSGSFTTDAQTQITNLAAGIGNTDGSILIRFDTEGPRATDWTISYSAPGIRQQQIHFQGNVIQITDLQVGLEYTFTLSRKDGQELAGQTQVQYTASRILLAQDLYITACSNGSLTAQWQKPEDAEDILWIVRCYNDSGYDKTVTTGDLTATFTGMEHDVPCTVEVTAEGMPRSVSTTIEANPVTIQDFHFTVAEDGTLEVVWDHTGTVTAGWILEYAIDGASQQSMNLTENKAKLLLIPGGSYTVNVSAVDATRQFGGGCEYLCPDADAFQGWGVTADELQGELCIRPEAGNWNAEEVPEEQFVSVFAPGQKIGLVLRCDKEPDIAEEMLVVRFVFYNSDGTLLYVIEERLLWSDIWAGSICGLDVPWLPEEAGEYRVCIYFAGQYVTELTFSVSETQ